MVFKKPFRAAAVCLLALCAAAGGARAQAVIGGILKGLEPLPGQPGEDAYAFVNDLKAPLWVGGHAWTPRAAARSSAAHPAAIPKARWGAARPARRARVERPSRPRAARRETGIGRRRSVRLQRTVEAEARRSESGFA